MHGFDPLPALPTQPLPERRSRRCAQSGGALLIALAGIAGCAVANSATPMTANSARVIVRFAPDVVDPADPAFLARLAASARVGRIDLIRPMSGDSYVMRIACDDSPQRPVAGACEAAIARVRAAASVLMIEPDGRETTR